MSCVWWRIACISTHGGRLARFNNVPDLFMSSEIWKEGMAQLIELFLNCRKQQDDMDMCCKTFCYSLTSEMDPYLKYSDSSEEVRKMYKNHKPYWYEELADLWVLVSKADKAYLKYKGHKGLLSCISKVCLGLINNRVINYCELGELLVDEQGGFRKNKPCVDHL